MSEIVTFGGKVIHGPSSEDKEKAQIARLLATVGNRVRKARSLASLSRRALSEKSGVSQRYLAQLESGQGNISIALLLSIAHALDFKLEWLVAEDDPWSSETGVISMLLPGATKEQLLRVVELLDPEHINQKRAKRIALIGLRGAGKSTLGRLCADELGLTFLELNDEIQSASGIPVHEVIALYGQEGYRHLEHQALERVVATHEELVLAVAGGIVSQPDTFNYLLRNYHTIWLKAAPEEHMTRVREQGDERPMAGNGDAITELRTILKNREKLYERAEARVDTSCQTLDDSLAAVITVIKEYRFLANR